jgi:effector-binding domain-containing protein
MTQEIKVVNTETTHLLSVRETIRHDQIKSKLGEMFAKVWAYMEQNRIRVAGPPFVIYHDYDKETMDAECGFPTLKRELGEGDVKDSLLIAARCAMTVHHGPYESIMGTYEQLQKYMKENGLRPKKVMWERYLNDPSITKPEDLMTAIYWPIE